MSDLIGQTIGNYEAVKEVGRGGMATVYLARSLADGREVAVKVISHHLAETADIKQRFAREIKVLLGLQHPHIVPILDYGEFQGHLYIVMPFMAEGTLQDRLEHGGLSPHEGARLMNQVSSALAYAHGQGVVHRDIKPSNILLDAEGNAMLTDFGLARVRDATLSLTGSGVIGTPSFMSPEQGQGKSVDARSDQYSLGVVLYKLATGRLPFEADTPVAAIVKHIIEPLPRPRSISPNLPPSVEAVLVRALSKNPAKRFPSVAAFNNAFQQALSEALSPSGRFLPQAPAPTLFSARAMGLGQDLLSKGLAWFRADMKRALMVGVPLVLLLLAIPLVAFAGRRPAMSDGFDAMADAGAAPSVTPTFLPLTLNAMATETVQSLETQAAALDVYAAETLAAMGGAPEAATPTPLPPTNTPLPVDLVLDTGASSGGSEPPTPTQAPAPAPGDDPPPATPPPPDEDPNPEPPEEPTPSGDTQPVNPTNTPKPTPTEESSSSDCSAIELEWYLLNKKIHITNNSNSDIKLAEVNAEWSAGGSAGGDAYWYANGGNFRMPFDGSSEAYLYEIKLSGTPIWSGKEYSPASIPFGDNAPTIIPAGATEWLWFSFNKVIIDLSLELEFNNGCTCSIS